MRVGQTSEPTSTITASIKKAHDAPCPEWSRDFGWGFHSDWSSNGLKLLMIVCGTRNISNVSSPSQYLYFSATSSSTSTTIQTP